MDEQKNEEGPPRRRFIDVAEAIARREAQRKARRMSRKMPNRYKVEGHGFRARYYLHRKTAVKRYLFLKHVAEAAPKITNLELAVSVRTSQQCLRFKGVEIMPPIDEPKREMRGKLFNLPEAPGKNLPVIINGTVTKKKRKTMKVLFKDLADKVPPWDDVRNDALMAGCSVTALIITAWGIAGELGLLP